MTETDRQWIERAIQHHDRRFPTGVDSIAMSVLSAKQEQFELEMMHKIDKKTGVIKTSDAGRRMTVAMPENLYMVLIRRYPRLFKDDIKWFKRKFPMFVIAKG